jgi:hypothetical protein
MKSSERNQIADETRCRQKYEVELAQGASHIASMLYPHTLRGAVQETVRAFADRHGRAELRMFLSTLASQLEHRGCDDAVPLVQDVAQHTNSSRFNEYLASLGSVLGPTTSTH